MSSKNHKPSHEILAMEMVNHKHELSKMVIILNLSGKNVMLHWISKFYDKYNQYQNYSGCKYYSVITTKYIINTTCECVVENSARQRRISEKTRHTSWMLKIINTGKLCSISDSKLFMTICLNLL